MQCLQEKAGLGGTMQQMRYRPDEGRGGSDEGRWGTGGPVRQNRICCRQRGVFEVRTARLEGHRAGGRLWKHHQEVHRSPRQDLHGQDRGRPEAEEPDRPTGGDDDPAGGFGSRCLDPAPTAAGGLVGQARQGAEEPHEVSLPDRGEQVVCGDEESYGAAELWKPVHKPPTGESAPVHSGAGND